MVINDSLTTKDMYLPLRIFSFDNDIERRKFCYDKTITSRIYWIILCNENQLPTIVIQGPIYSNVWQQLFPQLVYSIKVINSTNESVRSFQIDAFTNANSIPGYSFFINLFKYQYPK
ncbi:Adapter protein MecA [Dirofilaria immitis]